MLLFMKEMINQLDIEDKKWRSNTVIVWDGAGYHRSKEVIKAMEEQLIPLMFLGPYHYLMSPAELVFAALKSKKLNLNDAKLGKK